MNRVKIAVQNGLSEVEALLKEEGYDVYKYGHAGMDANVTIITGTDGAYEEIEPAQRHGKMLVINATHITTEAVVAQVHRYYSDNFQ